MRTLTPFNAEGEFQPFKEGGELRRIAIRSAGISFVGQGASFVVQMASTMVLARLLSPKDFGIVTMVTTVTLLFRSFGQNGFTELIMQREELTESLASNFFWIELAVGTFLTLGFAASAPLLALFYHDAAVTQVAWGMSLTIGISCLGWIHVALLQRANEFRNCLFDDGSAGFGHASLASPLAARQNHPTRSACARGGLQSRSRVEP